MPALRIHANVSCHMMTTILKDDYKTKLGTIRNWVESNLGDAMVQGDHTIKTLGHLISLQKFELKKEWFVDAMDIESSQGWRWHIEKINDTTETLHIYCKLINPTKDTSFGGSSGQYLDAIEIENKTEQLHIGTEDGEIMQSRAEKSDWMPNRFKEKLSDYYSFTEYIDYGFKTVVPHLTPGEKIYFHFLIATNTIKPSLEFQDERDISTWFAVDKHKPFLDKYFESQYGS